ncbi:MAG: hypothetical protein GY805_08810 [Chloroflexi bacterium]|nr:hypothetical protein [Chloroflexota bacterium]
MVKNKRKVWSIVGLLMLSVLISFSVASGQGTGERAIATLVVRDSMIEWDPQVEYAQLVLTITGPDDYNFRQVFRTGAAPSFSLADQALPDGQYSYELLVVPVLSPETMQTLASVREADAETRAAMTQELIAAGALPAEAQVQTGVFRIEGGSIAAEIEEVSGGVDSPSVNNSPQIIDVPTDQQILDDLIVVGSICVGLDCVNGESFGFDTIRLKENNLRIRFVDTSTTSSFPTNDWQITVNDSSNGGANKFSIDDIDGGRTPFTIEASAPSHSLYVDDGGRIGFGTSTPVVELHVKDGDTPTLRLEQDGSSGFTPQTWDVAANETNFFIRDATNGSTLPIRVRPGAPTSSIDVAANGNVGIGTSSPDASLEVERDDGTALLRIHEDSSTVANRFLLELENNGAPKFKFINSDSGVEWQFSMNSGNDFIIGETGVAGQEFLIRQNGSVQMGPGGAANFNLDAAGNLTIAGDFTAANFPAGGGELSFPSDLVKSLEAQIAEQLSEITALQQGNTQLEERLAALELLVQSLIENQQ